MALYGSAGDASFIRHINRELLHRIIDIRVLVYTRNLNSTQVNIYEETDFTVYDSPKLIHCLVDLGNQQSNTDDFGIDMSQEVSFAFLKDDLIDDDVVVHIGDIIEYKSRFFEIDNIEDNQTFMGRDPDNWSGGDTHGYDISIICQGHLTRQSKLNIIPTRFGNSVNIQNSKLPKNV
jgi:hypothetical protein